MTVTLQIEEQQLFHLATNWHRAKQRACECMQTNIWWKIIVNLNVNDFRSANKEFFEKMTEVQSHHVLVGFF